MDAYPSIGSLAKVYGTITFILEHPNEVEAYLLDQDRPGPVLHYHYRVLAYSPVRELQYIEAVNLARTQDDTDSLSFEKTVSNEMVQAWLTTVLTRKELNVRGDEAEVSRMNQGLSSIFGEAVELNLEREPYLRPKLRFGKQDLNLGQLPDGIRVVLGWLADIFRRSYKTQPPGCVLIDEVDAHLHPRWQRLILPALSKALPHTQLIVTTHSPFVVQSCDGARVHVLDFDMERSIATARAPADAPVGKSVEATLRDVFDIQKHFDEHTHELLHRWRQLSRRKQRSKTDEAQMKSLREQIADRGEELMAIVGNGVPLPRTLPKKR